MAASISFYLRSALAIALMLSAATAWSDRSIEDAVETYTNKISLPATETGSWIFQICSGCQTETVTLDKNSKFFIGSKAVALAELRKFANSSAPHSMTVFYRWTDHTLTRIVIDQ